MLSNKMELHSIEVAGCELNKAMFLSVIETLTFLNLSNNLILDIHADDVVKLTFLLRILTLSILCSI